MTGYKDYGFSADTPTYAHNYIFKPLMKVIEQKENRVILDLGCGNGWLVNKLVELGYEAYGTDASVSGIEIARRKNKNRFALQDLGSDGLPEAFQHIPFNTIISTEVIEHLYQPKAYIEFCKKILINTGGELIITTPYHGYLKNIVLAASNKMDQHFTALREGGHIKFWSRKTLSRLLMEKGFHALHFKGCGRLPYLWKSMLVNCLVEKH